MSSLLLDGSPLAWTVVVLIVLIVISLLVLISRQPVARVLDSFSVPLVPWLPGLSILVNFYLMVMLDYMTWVRFGVWITIGLVIYFAYGIRNSVERKRLEQKNLINDKRNEGKIFASSREILVPTGQ